MSKEDDRHAELRERIDHALAELTRGEGLTPANVQSTAPWLIETLGVKNAQEAHDLVRSTLETLDWSGQYPANRPTMAGNWGPTLTMALLNAFGGEGLPKARADRRRQYTRDHGITQQRTSAREKKARLFLADTLARIAEERRR